MLPPQLIAYLQQCKSQNLAFDQVVAQLRAHGWNDQLIAQAKQWYIGAPIHPANHKRLYLLTGVTVAVVVILTATVFTLIAYEKLALGSQTFRTKVADTVIGLPFMPKTPKFIFRQTTATIKKVTHAQLDLSLSAKANNLTEVIGSNELDIALKGPYDYTNIKAPRLSFNMSVTKDFNADVKLINKLAYLKVNKVPPLVTAALQDHADLVTKALGKWFSYDVSTLETEAQQNIKEYSAKKTPADQSKQEHLQQIFDEDILPTIEMTKDTVDSFPTYKLHLVVTKPMLDKIERELSRDEKGKITYAPTAKTSDLIKDFQVNYWIDRKAYYIRKVMISMKIKNENPSTTLSYSTLPAPGLSALTQDTVALVGVLKLSDFDKSPTIDIPKDATNIEDFITAATTELYAAPASYTDVATEMKSVRSQVDQYYQLKSAYPTSIKDLYIVYGSDLTEKLAAQDKIFIKLSQTKKSVLIYTLTQDISRPDAPYMIITVTPQGFPKESHLTKAQLDALLNSF